ncbi:hypothetical protein L6452_09980 [Arctium lappa]|uniref:Uncharacterized protein n=2 Tax=Arctium lappa TaxID=4217 RepID=A0ACB9DMS7_ARCLA|nr:hypothetical protein L6452_09979 [Arctium lappa]KAI3747521.1 hypothetical protein L6452_09980 [Arctium lappa]
MILFNGFLAITSPSSNLGGHDGSSSVNFSISIISCLNCLTDQLERRSHQIFVYRTGYNVILGICYYAKRIA